MPDHVSEVLQLKFYNSLFLSECELFRDLQSYRSIQNVIPAGERAGYFGSRVACDRDDHPCACHRVFVRSSLRSVSSLVTAWLFSHAEAVGASSPQTWSVMGSSWGPS